MTDNLVKFIKIWHLWSTQSDSYVRTKKCEGLPHRSCFNWVPLLLQYTGIVTPLSMIIFYGIVLCFAVQNDINTGS